MITRRALLKGLAALSAGSIGFGGYALAEPFRLGVVRYQVTPPGWPMRLKLRLAVLADLHVCEPFMSAARVRQIVARSNALAPDAVALLGDYVVSYRMARLARAVPHEVWADTLAGLNAPLGVHAVLGNHDWWEEKELQRTRNVLPNAHTALEAAGIPVYQNDAVRLEKDGVPFWIAGLGDQWAYWLRHEGEARNKSGYVGVDDLEGTLAKVTDDAPVILMAHEPDIFPDIPSRVALTLSGHTHGGQVRVLGYAPIVPSRFGQRYAYGHIVEEGRSLVVSGGLGCSGIPVRFGVPPEIVLIELGAETS